MHAKKCGRLEVIAGPMFSGKTTELIRLLEREEYAGKTTVMFKPEVDNRYHERNVVTHKGASHEALVVSSGGRGLGQIEKLGKGFEVVGIDEAQFFRNGKELIRIADSLADMGKTVIVSLLNRSHLGEPFGDAPEMIARADYVRMLTAVCRKCGNDATFTQRVDQNGREIFGKLVEVEGKDSYEPRCRDCFVKPR
ncbi:MAG: thymidine kinase [Candidatus Micrarchaeota archaeon]|nr:thymidine kinase [Candidatus Micrarchaeota archaeon]